MGLIDGDAFVSGDIFSFQQAERMKSHWPQAVAPTNPQAGMHHFDTDDDLLYNRQTAAWKEIVQVDTPISDGEQVIFGTNSDSSLQYDEATNDALIFGIPVASKRGLIFCDQADIGADFTALLGGAISEPRIALIDLDNDSFISWGFASDDTPQIQLQSGVYYSLIQESQAEGLAGSDTRIGVDESLRHFIICDRGDIGDDFNISAQANPTFYIFNAAGTAYYSLNSGGVFTTSSFGFSASGRIQMTVFADISSGNMFEFVSGGGNELTDTNGEQSWGYFEPKINQPSGNTGTWHGIYLNATITDQALLANRTTSGMNANTLINLEIESTPVWNVCEEKIVKAHDSDLFDAAALTDTSDIFILPANSTLLEVIMKLDTQFAGVTTLKIEVGITGDDTDGFLLPGAMDLTADAAGSWYSNHGAYWNNAAARGGQYRVDAATTITALATSTVDDLDQTSAGQVIFYIIYKTLVTTT